MKENLSSYQQWLGAIYLEVEATLHCSTSDAQGVVDGQSFVIAQQWALGAPPQTAALAIMKSAKKSP